MKEFLSAAEESAKNEEFLSAAEDAGTKSEISQLVEFLHIQHTIQNILIQTMRQSVDKYPVIISLANQELITSLYNSTDRIRQIREILEPKVNEP